jgi:hypothetical protein
VTGRQQIARLLPLVLLVVLVIVGLRGTVDAPRWDGPLKADGVAVGIALEVVLAALLVIVRVRDVAAKRAAERAAFSDVDKDIEPPEALRFTLRYVLTGGFLAVGAVLISNLHLHFFVPSHRRLKPIIIPRIKPPRNVKPGPSGPMFNVHIPWGAIGYALLALALVAAVAISIWWSARQRRPAAVPEIPDDGVSAEELRDAVASGRVALAALDDARAAIIACYAAMERSLAARGAARGVADTPDEVLARALARGVVRGDAAPRLTALFYEARFSTHPVGTGQRDAALAALDELSAELGAEVTV